MYEFFFCIAGLSPLARGTRPEPVYAESCVRFIPAGAGNTSLDLDTTN